MSNRNKKRFNSDIRQRGVTVKNTRWFPRMIVSVLIVLLMVPLSFSASADSYQTSCGAPGSDVMCVFVEETGVLTLKGTGAMKVMNSAQVPWKNFRSQIVSVVVCEGVTEIYGMGELENLETVSLPSTLETIGVLCFQGAAKLREIALPSGLKKIDGGAFSGCSLIPSLHIPASVETIAGGIAYNCDALTEITVDEANPNFYVESGCLIDRRTKTLLQGLSNSAIPQNGSVEIIAQNAFAYCDNLIQVEIPPSVTAIEGSAFKGCSKLTSVTAYDSIKEIGRDAFFGCSIAYREYENAYYIGNKEKPYLFLMQAKDDGDFCTIHPDTYFIYQKAFDNCDWLTEITIPESVRTIGYSAFNGCSELTTVTIREGTEEIEEYAFASCKKLQQVSLPRSLTTIRLRAFEQASALERITIPADVTVLEQSAFWGCTSLTEAKIEAPIEVLPPSMFSNCTNLKRVEIPDSLLIIDSYAFSECAALESIQFPSNLQKIGHCAFYGCKSLTSLTFPKTLTEIGSSAFSWCEGLQWVSVPADIGKVVIESEAFYYIDKLDIIYCADREDVNVDNFRVFLSGSPEDVTYLFHSMDCDKIGDAKTCRVCGVKRELIHDWGEWESSEYGEMRVCEECWMMEEICEESESSTLTMNESDHNKGDSNKGGCASAAGSVTLIVLVLCAAVVLFKRKKKGAGFVE
ncbi:MAG: leucine-rich repeat domain-containing protein [Ruminococcaceae bacterium]|nr:leucine-rich repeat domain-containing protein [Oscillospiraceae bacterium]